MTTVASKSVMQTVPVGTVRPCNFEAAWHCGHCGADLCAGHCKRLSTMKNFAKNIGRRRCSNCGHRRTEAFFAKGRAPR
jgi:DNA-directed RNA polymerase subunit RPC12/RpoP